MGGEGHRERWGRRCGGRDVGTDSASLSLAVPVVSLASPPAPVPGRCPRGRSPPGNLRPPCAGRDQGRAAPGQDPAALASTWGCPGPGRAPGDQRQRGDLMEPGKGPGAATQPGRAGLACSQGRGGAGVGPGSPGCPPARGRSPAGPPHPLLARAGTAPAGRGRGCQARPGSCQPARAAGPDGGHLLTPPRASPVPASSRASVPGPVPGAAVWAGVCPGCRAGGRGSPGGTGEQQVTA